jgi:LysM repeat protein
MKKVLLYLVLLIFSTLVVNGQTDSLGVKKEGDKFFVIHKVIAGQTLYSLSRRYGSSVIDIKNKNVELAQGLQVGQTILIPYLRPITTTQSSAGATHTVKTGETLFFIAKQYNLDVLDLKRLNGLNSNELSIGQVLKISVATNTPVVKAEQPIEKKSLEGIKEEVAKPAAKKVIPVQAEVKKPIEKGDDSMALETKDTTANTYDAQPFEEITEEGQAELIVEDKSSTKFLALHKTAKVGTVIKVKNRMNNLSVYVRVVGQIPKTTDNESIIIKINKRAYDQLKALDTRFLVELSYFK